MSKASILSLIPAAVWAAQTGVRRGSLPLLIRAVNASHPSNLQSSALKMAQTRVRRKSLPPLIRTSHPSSPSNLETQSSALKIAIVGFGNFGQFLAQTFIQHGHTLLAHSRTDYSKAAESLGVSFFSDPNDLCEQHPDVVLLSTSILSTAHVLCSLPIQRLRRNTLFAEVLSVKEFPKNLFLKHLPGNFDIICTHPMFGPESGKNGWTGLPLVFEKVRIGDSADRVERCHRFLDIFQREGCRMVEMSCAEHDANAAESQFLTHTVGRMLSKLDLKSTPVDTKGYEALLKLVENTCSDSFELYNGLFMYNKNSTELLERLDFAFDSLKKELFGKLHDVLKKQLFENS